MPRDQTQPLHFMQHQHHPAGEHPKRVAKILLADARLPVHRAQNAGVSLSGSAVRRIGQRHERRMTTLRMDPEENWWQR